MIGKFQLLTDNNGDFLTAVDRDTFLYADFPREVAVPPFRWTTQTYNVVQKTEMPKGGHFAALEQPDLLLDDIRKFFAKVDLKQAEIVP
jgi:pimeloyl-ACP methyl ester carboxylesterase